MEIRTVEDVFRVEYEFPRPRVAPDRHEIAAWNEAVELRKHLKRSARFDCDRKRAQVDKRALERSSAKPAVSGKPRARL